MRIGLDARTIFSPRPRGTGRNLFDAYRLIPGLRPEWSFRLYHRRPASVCPLYAAETAPDDARPAWEYGNCRLRRVNMPGDRFDAWFQFRLPLAALRDRVDLMHYPANAAPFYSPIPFVITIHDLVPLKVNDELSPRQRKRFRRGIERGLRAAARIITPSQATADELHADFGVRPERVSVIPWAPDGALLRASVVTSAQRCDLAARYKLDRPWLLNFSGNSSRKNARNLLAGIAQLPAEVRNRVRFLFIGCEPASFRAALSSAAERLGVAEVCRLTGFAPHGDLPLLLREARGLLMPSLREGFGLPILDAFATDTPVVTSACSSMPEVAGEAAVYCDPQSPSSIGAAIGKLLDDIVASDLVRAGRKRLARFTWERTARAMCGVYDTALSVTRRRSSGAIKNARRRVESWESQA